MDCCRRRVCSGERPETDRLAGSACAEKADGQDGHSVGRDDVPQAAQDTRASQLSQPDKLVWGRGPLSRLDQPRRSEVENVQCTATDKPTHHPYASRHCCWPTLPRGLVRRRTMWPADFVGRRHSGSRVYVLDNVGTVHSASPFGRRPTMLVAGHCTDATMMPRLHCWASTLQSVPCTVDSYVGTVHSVGRIAGAVQWRRTHNARRRAMLAR
jgi:hypothetical protein